MVTITKNVMFANNMKFTKESTHQEPVFISAGPALSLSKSHSLDRWKEHTEKSFYTSDHT